MIRLPLVAMLVISSAASALAAEDIVVPMHVIDAQGVGKSIGSVTLTATADKGVTLVPDLKGLPPGPHGFHLHEKANCEPGTANGKPTAGLAAGGHYDPGDTGSHAGPTGRGHFGDLPVLVVEADGSANQAVTAPRLALEDMRNHALMIHAGGDTYTDEPPLGGGGARIACGVVP